MLKHHVASPAIPTFSEAYPLAKPPAARRTVPTQVTWPALEHDVLDFSETDKRKHDEVNNNDDVDKLEDAPNSKLQKSLSSLDIDLVGLAGLVGD
jgi:hypothetical protein